jgi:hypothetical protein
MSFVAAPAGEVQRVAIIERYRTTAVGAKRTFV